MDQYGLSKEDAAAYFMGDLDEAGVHEAFRRACVNTLAEHGVSEETARDIFDLKLQHGDAPDYFQEAFALLVARGEPVDSILQVGQELDDPDGVLSTAATAPGDIEVEIEGRVDVAVSVPPFVTVSAGITVRVSGDSSDLAHMQEHVGTALEQIGPIVEQELQEQLDDLSDEIEDLVKEFGEFSDGLDLPNWLLWLV